MKTQTTCCLLVCLALATVRAHGGVQAGASVEPTITPTQTASFIEFIKQLPPSCAGPTHEGSELSTIQEDAVDGIRLAARAAGLDADVIIVSEPSACDLNSPL